LAKTQYTISLAQFVEAFIVYVEQSHRTRVDSDATAKQPFPRATDSMTAETLQRIIYGEDFLQRQDLISEKIGRHAKEIRELFSELHVEEPGLLPLSRLKEFWFHLRMLTRCVMVKAGTTYCDG